MDKRHVNFLNKHIKKIEPYKIGGNVNQLKKNFALDFVVQLSSNENPGGATPKAITALKNYAAHLSMYPNNSDLKSELADSLDLPDSKITLGNGSTELLYMIALGFINPTSSAIISQYAYSYYKRIIYSVGASIINVPTKGWACDLDAIKNVINKKTKLILIDNPNNPTGTLIPFQALNNFINDIPEDIVVVIDEAYHEYVTSTDYSSTAKLIDKYPNLIVLRSFSKAYGLAGLRVGYSIANFQITQVLNRIMSPFSVNSLALIAAQAALGDKQYLANSILLNKQGLQQLYNGFTQLGIDYIPSHSNFIMAKLNKYQRPINEKLLQKGILVRSLEEYKLTDYFRVTVGLPWMNNYVLDTLRGINNEEEIL